MTVKELIAKLERFSPSATVQLLVDESHGVKKDIDSVDTEDDAGELVVVIYPGGES